MRGDFEGIQSTEKRASQVYGEQGGDYSGSEDEESGRK